MDIVVGASGIVLLDFLVEFVGRKPARPPPEAPAIELGGGGMACQLGSVRRRRASAITAGEPAAAVACSCRAAFS